MNTILFAIFGLRDENKTIGSTSFFKTNYTYNRQKNKDDLMDHYKSLN